MFVKPVEGRAVRDPKSMMLLPAEGREVPDTDAFWARRVRDGDVTVQDGEQQPDEEFAAPQREA